MLTKDEGKKDSEGSSSDSDEASAKNEGTKKNEVKFQDIFTDI